MGEGGQGGERARGGGQGGEGAEGGAQGGGLQAEGPGGLPTLSQAWTPYSITSLVSLLYHKLGHLTLSHPWAPYNDHGHPNPFVRDDGCMWSWPPFTPELTMCVVNRS